MCSALRVTIHVCFAHCSHTGGIAHATTSSSDP
jgi:hypothetical protein